MGKMKFICCNFSCILLCWLVVNPFVGAGGIDVECSGLCECELGDMGRVVVAGFDFVPGGGGEYQ